MQQNAYQTILQKAFDRKIPFNAQIELTYKCNLSCIHCYATRRDFNNEISTSEAEGLMKQLADMGCLYLSLTGGEILCRSDLVQLLRTARKNNLAVNLFTNGTLLTETLADQLKDIAPLCVHISLYAMSPAIHDAITGTHGSHAKTMAAIRLCGNRGINVAVKTPLMKGNVGEFPAIKRFASDIGAHFIFDFLLVPTDSGTQPMRQHGLSEEEIFNFLCTNTDPILSPPSSPAMSDALCGAGASTVCITPAGEVLPCLAIRQSAGNIRQAPLSRIWKSPDLDRIRNLRYCTLPECRDCAYLAFCSRCSGAALAECGNIAGKSDCACIVAKAAKRATESLRCST